MKLQRLDIQALPGIEPGFLVSDMAPGINLVTGPNAIGKSSLVRALWYLVGGNQPGDPKALSLAATFVDDRGAQWRVQRAGSQIAWSRDGRASEPPPLPSRDRLHCYWLSMEDLLAADEADHVLVAELRTALAGGYNLAALRGDPDFHVGPRAGHSEGRRLQAAERELRQVETDYATLRRDEARLPELRQRIETARQAAVRVELLERALTLLAAREHCRELAGRLETFPEGMERLRGDEPAKLDKLAERRAALNADLEAARQRRTEAAAALDETGLGESRPTAEALETQKGYLEQARRDSEALADRRERLVQARAEEQQALTTLGGGAEAPELSPEHVAEAETLAGRLQARQSEADEIAARLEDAPPAPSEQQLFNLGRAAEALRAWQAAAQPPGLQLHAGPVLALIGALIAAVGALWSAVEPALAGRWSAAWAALGAGGVPVWAGLTGLGIALAGLVWAVVAVRAPGRRQARRRFADTGLEPPAEWAPDPVAERLDAVEAERARLHRDQARAQEAEADRRRLARAREKLAELGREKRVLAERFGFDPQLTAVGLDHFVRRVSEYQQAAAARAALQEAVTRLERDIEAELTRVRDFLARWQANPEDTLAGLSAALRGLESRCRRAEEAERQRRQADAESARLAQELSRLEQDEAEVFSKAGLAPGQRRVLEERCERLADWQALRDALRGAEMREAEQRRALEEEPALLAQVEAGDRAALEAERDRAAADAGQLETLQRQHTQIETRLAEAGRDRRLERALAEHGAAREALQDRFDEALFAEAGRFLLDTVEAEHRSEHEPAVLRDARARFQRFTHHGWDLALDDEHGFLAHDQSQGARRTLAELSAGTRMQLLLAVRLAWTRRIEQGREALPLFLDEALTTADEHRFDAVAQSLASLAADEGRQVFYLSARRAELALWERATGEQPHHIDLAAVRFAGEAVPAEAFALPERAILPAPGDRPPAEYAAALGVPAVDPRQPPGQLHLFHLLRDDLPLLHRLMEDWRVDNLGRLETLLGSTAARAAIPDAAVRDRLAGRCATARAWADAWRRGRGRPVDRTVLERSGAVTDTYMDRVAALAEEVGGDAEALIQGLREGRVKGFRSSKTEELAEWLAEHGYIDPAEPLSGEDRERQTLMEAAAAAPAEEIRQVVAWLEAALGGG